MVGITSADFQPMARGQEFPVHAPSRLARMRYFVGQRNGTLYGMRGVAFYTDATDEALNTVAEEVSNQVGLFVEWCVMRVTQVSPRVTGWNRVHPQRSPPVIDEDQLRELIHRDRQLRGLPLL